MRKFKTTFLIVYILAAISSITIIYYEAIILEMIQDVGYWLDLNRLPVIGSHLVLLLSALMLVEFIIQKLTINKLKNTINEQKEEVMSIKSKLYDKITNDNAAINESNDDLNQSALKENEEY